MPERSNVEGSFLSCNKKRRVVLCIVPISKRSICLFVHLQLHASNFYRILKLGLGIAYRHSGIGYRKECLEKMKIEKVEAASTKALITKTHVVFSLIYSK